MNTFRLATILNRHCAFHTCILMLLIAFLLVTIIFTLIPKSQSVRLYEVVKSKKKILLDELRLFDFQSISSEAFYSIMYYHTRNIFITYSAQGRKLVQLKNLHNFGLLLQESPCIISCFNRYWEKQVLSIWLFAIFPKKQAVQLKCVQNSFSFLGFK